MTDRPGRLDQQIHQWLLIRRLAIEEIDLGHDPAVRLNCGHSILLLKLGRICKNPPQADGAHGTLLVAGSRGCPRNGVSWWEGTGLTDADPGPSRRFHRYKGTRFVNRKTRASSSR